jgi:ATP-dependent protease ClpP protease subunit
VHAANATHLSFCGAIDPQGAARLADALNAAVNKGVEEVYLTMSSPGGYVADGIFLYNHIRALPLAVHMHNIGSISSIAVAVFLAAKHRYASRHAAFLIHPTTVQASNASLAPAPLRSALDTAIAEDARTEEILRAHARLPEEMLAARRHRDVFLGADDAVRYGLADAVREFALPKGRAIYQI